MTRFAVVHPNTLLARELREQLAARPDLAADVRLLSTDEAEVGQLAESGGAATFVGRADAAALEEVALAFFCGALEQDRPLLAALPPETRAVVLSAGATREEGTPYLPGLGRPLPDGALLVPHPAATGAALLLAPLAALAPRAAQIVALLPVSRYGEAGVEALFEQTRALLAFKTPKRSGPLRAQLAFNELPAADEADEAAAQLAALLGGGVDCAAQLLEVGVFHGVGLSLRVELGVAADVPAIRRRLAGDPRIELARRPEAASPVALAGSHKLVVGDLRPAGAGAFWIWAAFDNLARGGAATAVEIAEQLAPGASPPS